MRRRALSSFLLLLALLAGCGDSPPSEQDARDVASQFLSATAGNEAELCDLLSDEALAELAAANSADEDPQAACAGALAKQKAIAPPFNADELQDAAGLADSAEVSIDGDVATVVIQPADAAPYTLVLVSDGSEWKVDDYS